MSTLLYALGRWSYRRPWRVIATWALLLALAGGGAVVFSAGTDNTFSIPGTESQEGIEQLARTFPQASGTSAQLIVVTADGAPIDEAPYKDAIEDAVGSFGDLDQVSAATDPFDENVSGLVSDDDSAAIVRLQFDGQTSDVTADTKTDLREVTTTLQDALPDGSQVLLGGDLFSQSIPGVTITEAIGLIIALLVLIVTFRSFVVAGLPLLTAILGVGLSMTLIFIATAFATVSSTTPLLALMLGLAVGIDYSLFIVARHQDQVRAGMPVEESAARATGTAGSAVVFAGITVLIALIGLSFAGIPFLTTMGIAASVAVFLAVLVATTLTPALLGLLKERVRGRMPRHASSAASATPAPADDADPDSVGEGSPRPATRRREKVTFSRRWVRGVMKHPVLTTVAVVVGLGIATVPLASLTLALPNAGMLPADTEARQSYDLVSEKFGPGFNGPIIMTGTIVTSTDPLGLMTDLGDDIATLPGVKTVALATPNETADTGIVQLIPTTAPDDPATAALVRELRDQHDRLLDEYGVDLKVTGFTAVAIDISDQLGAALIPFGLFVVGLSIILLAIVFRSIWVPIKATLGYLLSIGAAFGVVSAVFSWGWFADILHVSSVGPIISFMPIVVMGVLFGLAMDYEVFLVSRMREDYVHRRRSHPHESDRTAALGAVESGFVGSSRVVVAAAIIMFSIFAAFVPEGDSSLKPIALGLAVGVFVDAFVVRMTLVPAVMTLLGAKAWWIPRWLDRLLPHFDVEGEAVERELAMADWPEPDTTAVVVGTGIALRQGDLALYDDVAVRVDSGETLVVTGADRRSIRALLLTFAGRVTPSEGTLKVAGHLLPARAAWVRSHVGVALIGGDDGFAPVKELQRALAGTPRLVVIDGLDTVTDDAERDQVMAALRDAAERARSADRRLTIIAGAVDDTDVRLLLGATGSIVDTLDLRLPPRRDIPAPHDPAAVQRDDAEHPSAPAPTTPTSDTHEVNA
ncbi:efflux RND transporter permease subunit [Microbacterium sp. P03]|uniref:efflux RND transporter permease subunit n=1 Tax=Microbacterium sp. P03 TaxID=3366946 RepID=UPI00374625CA